MRRNIMLNAGRRETYTEPRQVYFQAQPALTDLPLIVTVEQLDVARDRGAYIIVQMSCMDFLRLTTADRQHLAEIIEDSPETPEVFNVYSIVGVTTVMPTLRIWTGRLRMKGPEPKDLMPYVTGHEGRHRCGSVINAVGRKKAWVYVAIDLDFGPKEMIKYGTQVKYLLDFEDIPPIVQSQPLYGGRESQGGGDIVVETDEWLPKIPNLDAMNALLRRFKKPRHGGVA